MKKLYFIISPVVLIATYILFLSNAAGPAASGNGNRTGSPGSSGTCSSCHSGGSFGTSISATITDLSNNPVTSYIPGNSYYVEYQVSSTSGTPKYGFQSVMLTSTNANAGDFDSTLTVNTQITTILGKDYPEHSAKSTTGNFKVRWVAPATGTGTVTLYYIGNAVNSNFSTSGDQGTSSQSLSITEQPVFTLSLNQVNGINCFGDSTASVTGSVINGVSPYTYSVNGGAPIGPIPLSSVTVPNLGAGTYHVTAIDANGDVSSDSIVILQPTLLVNSQSHTDETCFQLSNGSATVTPSGGTAPYTYIWSTGGATSTVSNLPPGSHFVTITDDNGCTIDDTITINMATQIIINETITHPVCVNDTDGTISINISGGAGPYSYAWSSGETGFVISGKDTGTYMVTVTDVLGCTEFETYQLISNNFPPMVNLGPDTIICDTSIGKFSISAGDLTNNYSYLWNTGDTSYSLTIFFTGDYALKVTDNLGCVGSDSITIGETTCLNGIVDLFAQNQVRLYPNPAKGNLFIESEVEGDLVMYDVFGKEILTTKVQKGKIQISLAEVSSGTYFIVIQSDESVGIQKIIVL